MPGWVAVILALVEIFKIYLTNKGEKDEEKKRKKEEIILLTKEGFREKNKSKIMVAIDKLDDL